MILVHFHQRMESPATGIEDLVGWTVWIGLETKAWSLFALLFGAGFAILLMRAESRGMAIVPMYLRRLAALAVIGYAVQTLTGFHILLEYAMWGIPLLIVRKWPSPVLLALAIAFSFGNLLYGPIRVPNLISISTANFSLFLLGFLAVRHWIFTRARGKRRVIVGVMAFGFVSWTLAWILYDDGPRELGVLSDRWLSLTYGGAVVLLLAYRPIWESRLSIFGDAGRMALTNYVVQAAIISSLASSGGSGLKIRPYATLFATAILFGVLALFSRLWLSRFRYGPLEWLWRVVTYWRNQPLIAATATARPAAPA